MTLTRGSWKVWIKVGLCIGGFLALLNVSQSGWADSHEKPRGNHMVCGSCPEGYARTGVTTAPSVCQDDDPTLVQCVPLGASRLTVCGECPSGYSRVGSSSVPSQCGDEDGGLVSQCQLEGGQGGLSDSQEG